MKQGRRRDRRVMGRALALARLNQGLTGVNPSVGCVILSADGWPVGEGVTGVGGRPHAEQVALDAAGARAGGGTAYVTLEPCRERSTGEASCANRLVEAGIARVVCAIADPHPTARDGFAILRAAGVDILVGPGRDRAARLYRGFFAGIAPTKGKGFQTGQT